MVAEEMKRALRNEQKQIPKELMDKIAGPMIPWVDYLSMKEMCDKLFVENRALKKQVGDLNTVLAWAQGYDDVLDTLFEPPVGNKHTYWWRVPLQKLTNRANNGTL